MGCTSSVEIVVEEEELPMPTMKPPRSFIEKIFSPKISPRFFWGPGGWKWVKNGRALFFLDWFFAGVPGEMTYCVYIYIYHAYIFHVFFGDLFVHQILRDLLTANSEPSSKRDTVIKTSIEG